MKKWIGLLLAACLCLGLLTGCGSRYIWSNEAGLQFNVDKLDYEALDPATVFDTDGWLRDVRGLDYVTLPEDIHGLQVPAGDIAVSDEQLDDYVDGVMQGFAVTEQITDRAVADGDRVNIDFVGTVGGVAFSGGNTNGAGTTVTAGSTEFVDDFLTQIIGHMPGETFDVTVTFPEGYNDATDAEGNVVVLSGQEAVFTTTLNYIEGETTVPECTDEWVEENLGDYGFSTVQDVREDLRAYYRARNLYQYVVGYLADNSVFVPVDELPRTLLDFAACNLLHGQLVYAANIGAPSMEDLLKVQGYDSVEAYLDESAQSLVEDVHNMLLTQALCETLDIRLSAQETQAMLGDEYETYIQQYGESYTSMYANISRCYSTLTSEAEVVE